MEHSFNLQQYLDRIQYAGTVDTSLATLFQLQTTHLLHVPFENLDIHTNTPIDLTNLFDKIVTRKRGGFCYELNGLFYQLLQAIGFTVKMVSARVYSEENGYSEEFEHLTLIITITEEDYLVDVGFGEFVFQPVKIAMNTTTEDPRGTFKIEPFNHNYIAIKKKQDNGMFVPQFIFSELARELDEFEEMCIYQQTNEASHFKQKRICSLPNEHGRITLTGNILKITNKEQVTQTVLTDELQVQQVLWDRFGIKL